MFAPIPIKMDEFTQGTRAELTCGRAIADGRTGETEGVPGGPRALGYQHRREGQWSCFRTLYRCLRYGERFIATLTFRFAKGSLPAPEDVETLVAEVFADHRLLGTSRRPPNESLCGRRRPRRRSIRRWLPQAEPKSINLGMTIEQVVASFGQPEKFVKLGAKQIYEYKDLKVTFVNNKVTDVK